MSIEQQIQQIHELISMLGGLKEENNRLKTFKIFRNRSKIQAGMLKSEKEKEKYV